MTYNKKENRKIVLLFFIKVLVIAALIYITLTKILLVTVCHENNMYPSIKDGDLCIALRIATPVNGDPIVYKNGDSLRYGRICATEGHEVNITEDGYFIDGMLQSEALPYPTTADEAKINLPYNIENGNIFVLNDYRLDSNDSRQSGTFNIESDVLGKIVLVIRRRGI